MRGTPRRILDFEKRVKTLEERRNGLLPTRAYFEMLGAIAEKRPPDIGLLKRAANLPTGSKYGVFPRFVQRLLAGQDLDMREFGFNLVSAGRELVSLGILSKGEK